MEIGFIYSSGGGRKTKFKTLLLKYCSLLFIYNLAVRIPWRSH